MEGWLESQVMLWTRQRRRENQTTQQAWKAQAETVSVSEFLSLFLSHTPTTAATANTSTTTANTSTTTVRLPHSQG